VLVAGGLSLRFLGQWCHIVAVDVGRFHTLVAGVLECGIWICDGGGEGQGGLGVVLVVRLLERRLLSLLLLVKDLDGVLKLRESCSFFINVLSSSSITLSYCLPYYDRFLFLVKPLYLLLNSG
jgi:hypothetical protein